MGFVIRPFRETDRAAVIALTVAAFPGVSIGHNVDERLGAVAGGTGNGGKGETSNGTSILQELSWRLPRMRRTGQRWIM